MDARCGLHGAGTDPRRLVGRRLERVIAAWHHYGSEVPTDPLDVWLVDDQEGCTHVTTGSDWCLIVEGSPPHEGYDMQEYGRVEVGPIGGETPFARHLGEEVLAVAQEYEPRTGRIALDLVFPSGRVRCRCREGDLRLSDA
ncbi:hypothetical protein [Saccharothrix luteola]|uniref:hypothetical protein n=1 Tax=Saccharothrix luteola TaxID=2893018 RepID=UPI001E4829A4|nr:hypothetical protein [Saccharothrix luteola]MCC8248624.1 hypothetical protein [Saccharothrix luteola]